MLTAFGAMPRCLALEVLLCEAFYPSWGGGPDFVNPTGLNAKHGVVAELCEAGVWLVWETHLTKPGVESFSVGLQMAGSAHKMLSG